ncbi:response regulator transcription factor [Brevibacterium album]|uniref:response regulator transcription factor n=1 Tax=Brevibacterium album TaxID=417948 RepID=UPI0003F70987|nr:response regulator transcription factor [Brevibacterium album]
MSADLKLLLVDDDLYTLRALEAFLGDLPDVRIAGTAPDGAAAVEEYERLRPDLTLMDLTMPVMTGVVATQRIRALDPGAKILVLTTVAPGPGLANALHAGALAAVRKTAPPEVLGKAIRAIMDDDPSALFSELPGDLIISGGIQTRSGPMPYLSPAELRVLELICRGMGRAETAEELVISPNTVKTHTARLLYKLDASNQAQLVVRALECGFISGL